MSKVYVVEWKDKGKWKPVAEAQPKRKEARRMMEYEWKHNYPGDVFRVATYRRVKGKRGKK